MQENIAENEPAGSDRFKMLHGAAHRRFVIFHVPFGRQVDDIKRNPDAVGLPLQQLRRDAVHRRPPGAAVDCREQCDDLVTILLQDLVEGEGGIFAAAPVENRFRADVVRHGIGFCAVSVNVPVSPDSAQNSALTSVKYSGSCPSRLHFNSL